MCLKRQTWARAFRGRIPFGLLLIDALWGPEFKNPLLIPFCIISSLHLPFRAAAAERSKPKRTRIQPQRQPAARPPDLNKGISHWLPASPHLLLFDIPSQGVWSMLTVVSSTTLHCSPLTLSPSPFTVVIDSVSVPAIVRPRAIGSRTESLGF